MWRNGSFIVGNRPLDVRWTKVNLNQWQCMSEFCRIWVKGHPLYTRIKELFLISGSWFPVFVFGCDDVAPAVYVDINSRRETMLLYLFFPFLIWLLKLDNNIIEYTIQFLQLFGCVADKEFRFLMKIERYGKNTSIFNFNIEVSEAYPRRWQFSLPVFQIWNVYSEASNSN